MVMVERNVFQSMEVATKEGTLRIDEGDTIEFATDDGEKVKGVLKKISGKESKTKLRIIPDGGQKEEIWSVVVMAEDSLSVVRK